MKEFRIVEDAAANKGSLVAEAHPFDGEMMEGAPSSLDNADAVTILGQILQFAEQDVGMVGGETYRDRVLTGLTARSADLPPKVRARATQAVQTLGKCLLGESVLEPEVGGPGPSRQGNSGTVETTEQVLSYGPTPSYNESSTEVRAEAGTSPQSPNSTVSLKPVATKTKLDETRTGTSRSDDVIAEAVGSGLADMAGGALDVVGAEDELEPADTTNLDPVSVYFQSVRKKKIPLLTPEQEVDLAKRIEAGVYAECICAVQRAKAAGYLEALREAFITESVDRQARKAPGQPSPKKKREYQQNAERDVSVLFNVALAYPASEEVLEELEWLVRDGRESEQRFIESNLRLAGSVAKRYVAAATAGLDSLDLIQEGNLGLMHAVQKFDYTKGCKFSTYATWWIRDAILKAIDDKKSAIRIPGHMRENLQVLRSTEADLLKGLGRRPTAVEVAAELSVTTDVVKGWRDARRKQTTYSLSAPMGDDYMLGDIVVEDNEVTAPDIVTWRDSSDRLDNALHDTLTTREYRVFMMRSNGMSLEKIGSVLGVSRERIRCIETEAKAKLLHPSSITRFIIETSRDGGEELWQPNCIEVGTAAMFVYGADQKHVKQICGGCALLEVCAFDGLSQETQVGVWGGMTTRERNAALRKQPKLAVAARSRSRIIA